MGLWHLHLHTNNSQGDKFRYNLRPLGKGKQWFFGTQTRENMFLVSSVLCQFGVLMSPYVMGFC